MKMLMISWLKRSARLDLNLLEAGPVSNLATNILLPARAEWTSVDDKYVKLSSPIQMPVSTNSWIGIREGQSAVLIRMFFVDALNGIAPQLVRQADSSSLSYQVARLTAYHYRGTSGQPVVLSSSHLKVGVLIVAYHCASDQE
jgi:hypothetical protein